MILKCVKVVAAAAFALVSLNVSGQDLLARQAPIDRKLKAVDSVALIRQIKAEKSAYPAYSLYPNWSNERVHAYGNTVTIPDTFRIDMTGFRMPTEHTKITSKFGPRRRRMHNGLDIKVYIGDTIRAAFSGKVRMVKYERRGYGKYVVIRHENGLRTYRIGWTPDVPPGHIFILKWFDFEKLQKGNNRPGNRIIVSEFAYQMVLSVTIVREQHHVIHLLRR